MADPEKDETTEERIGLHSLKPAPGSRKSRKRVGRGEGSNGGKTAGRGHKGAGARAGSKQRVNFEGGQMPIHMRLGKLRGPTKKMSMPFEPFRTHTQAINVADLERKFDAGAEVTLDALRGKNLAKKKNVPVKLLAGGEISKALTIHVHKVSPAAQAKVEAAGGTVVLVES